ncbi:putative lipase domain-containing protein [Neospora caninum Liverpool]|uniref:Lipase domain-containing protein, putative n=1 Tax=Neospora caninum (strain Liverpool) TaxID=572307 RepID=F0VRN3_NEOCL|nr:putative lipase domain-containing protein [Neospora caninum Liverpool]CBZ56381.1 putative lipase domain-containing protein [Neospora caninum Liverpool]CEL71141.1 TPA: lipase domain-containing protein, putative [Neospora caninum Liverpool]|eukprot:XP_003886406.1 putative lipase domain-containing protein [Neospora caninum Liverpool]
MDMPERRRRHSELRRSERRFSRAPGGCRRVPLSAACISSRSFPLFRSFCFSSVSLFLFLSILPLDSLSSVLVAAETPGTEERQTAPGLEAETGDAASEDSSAFLQPRAPTAVEDLERFSQPAAPASDSTITPEEQAAPEDRSETENSVQWDSPENAKGGPYEPLLSVSAAERVLTLKDSPAAPDAPDYETFSSGSSLNYGGLPRIAEEAIELETPSVSDASAATASSPHAPSFSSAEASPEGREDGILLPVLENEVLSISLILGHQEGDGDCIVQEGESLATMFKNGDLGGILKSLVGVTSDFSRWASPFRFLRLLPPSRAAKALSPTSSASPSRAFSPESGKHTRTLSPAKRARLAAAEAKPLGRKRRHSKDREEAEAARGGEEAARDRDAERDSPTAKDRRNEPPFFVSRLSADASSSASLPEAEAVPAAERADSPAPGNEVGAFFPFHSAQRRVLSLTTAQRMFRFFTSVTKENLGLAVCQALTGPTVNSRAFCSLLNVMKNEVICKHRVQDCSAIPTHLFATSAGSSPTSLLAEHLFPPITVPPPASTSSSKFAFPASASVLELPLVSLQSVRSSSSLNVPEEVVALEGPTYALAWEGLRRLYDYFELRVCEEASTRAAGFLDSLQVEATPSASPFSPAPQFLPGWETEMILNAVQPGTTPRSPLAVIARRGKTVLILIRGTQTQFEWALNAQYELTFGWNDMWDGKVESGFSRVFAAISPAIQVYLGELKRRGNIDRILVSGHSLGAAVSCLLSYSLSISFANVEAILFAPPRSGDDLFMKAWGRRVNGRAVKFSLDPVIEVPCRIMPLCDGKEDLGRKKWTQTASVPPGAPASAAVSDRAGTSPSDDENLRSNAGIPEMTPASWSRAQQAGSDWDSAQLGGFARDRPLELLKYREEEKNALTYADYPHSVVFTPADLPNSKEQSTLHAKYNHFCAYSCWLSYRFNTRNPNTHCGKESKSKRRSDRDEDDPSLCPAV